MFPLHDDVPSERFPIVNYAIIGINIAMWVLELAQGREIDRFFLAWAVVPGQLTGALRPDVAPPELITPLTAMFLHGGWMHVIGNMWFLFIFGDNVEGRLGHVRYLLFYLASGLAATAAQVALAPDSRLPLVGASGAIAGVLGAYMVMFPYSRVLTLLTLGFFATTVRIAAPWFLGIWFGMQALSGLASLGVRQATGGVAWWAHIGGFVVGFLVAQFFKGGSSRGRGRRWDYYYDRFDRY
jgi:membrane associated rhomboid family serine protease